ncbi:Leucyl aminopeptidase yscIV, partial [Coemansia sp. RSA 2399]
NWEHFWLNEGWTTYFERKIVSRLNGEDARQLSLAVGYRSLKDDVELYGKDSPLTALVPDLDGIDPDDAFSRIPYEKGSLLIYHLEQLFDPVIWNHISKMYIRKFEGQSIGTGDFYDFLRKYVEHYLDKDAEKKLGSVNWEVWFKGAGMPPVEFNFDEKPQRIAVELAERWWASRDSSEHTAEGFPPHQFNTLLTRQKVTFLDSFKDKGNVPHAMLGSLDKTYGLSSSRNCEVRFSWLALALKSNYMAVVDAVVDMLSTQGRMKFTRPLYRLLHASTDGREIAEKTFLRLRRFYHPICARMVEKDLGL